MLQIVGVTKNYGEISVLKDFSLELQKGDIVGIVGKSGCGKTTLLRILVGTEEDYTGEILLEGKSIRNTEPCDRNMALVYQEPVLWNHMTVRENILFSLSREAQLKKKELLAEITEKLEIKTLLSRYPNEISGGQAKRVSLARAMISEKEILLLDEPLSNIDEQTRQKVLQYLKTYLDGKKTVLYVSHDMTEVREISHRIVTLV